MEPTLATEGNTKYTGFQGSEATRSPFSFDSLKDLFLAPQRFFRTVRLDAHPVWLVALWICGISAIRGKVDQQAMKADLGGRISANPIFDSWPAYWLLVLGVGILWAAFIWYVGGWWYAKRLEWARVDEVDARTARLTYTWAGVVASLPSLLVAIGLTAAYPSYRIAWDQETWASTSLLVFLFWSIFTSWRGAHTIFGARGMRSYVWFLILPAAVYGVAFVALVGYPTEKAASRDAMMNPPAIDWFVRFAEESIEYQWRAAPRMA